MRDIELVFTINSLYIERMGRIEDSRITEVVNAAIHQWPDMSEEAKAAYVQALKKQLAERDTVAEQQIHTALKDDKTQS